MLLYILFLVILIKIIINLFIKINIEKFTSKQDIVNVFHNTKDEPSNTDSSSSNITHIDESYIINSDMHNELTEQSTTDISLNNGLTDYIERLNFYDEHIYQINNYIDEIHNPNSDSGNKKHIYNLANDNNPIKGSPQIQFDRIIDNYKNMYNKFTEYQTNDIKEKINQYENAKNYI